MLTKIRKESTIKKSYFIPDKMVTDQQINYNIDVHFSTGIRLSSRCYRQLREEKVTASSSPINSKSQKQLTAYVFRGQQIKIGTE